ncbi:uncharacterized protein MYCFIDRAFT_197404 [Pseudocercospora fijiensis CIRAD86]|uniref:Uncharacterized protein n=1 Tax=Pseudocercospora fijiensis (strain CIRAD86) TaxID=383855 RepID=M3ACE8_PSEFD|nr:uncharacterized protein MYCFIDRAFT_197404 [Pseudocercospora fijiensis CIRAD86]EME82226.1 hypothetical protein MYCFIDRAFT_197404 [Pseudocercospora fijiensis CIRAD86]
MKVLRICRMFQAFTIEEPEWPELSRERSKSDPTVALYDTRARAPELLARCDKLMEHETLYTSYLNSLYNDLYALRSDFGSWTITFGDTRGFDTLPQDLTLPKGTFADGQDEMCYTFTDSNHASASLPTVLPRRHIVYETQVAINKKWFHVLTPALKHAAKRKIPHASSNKAQLCGLRYAFIARTFSPESTLAAGVASRGIAKVEECRKLGGIVRHDK